MLKLHINISKLLNFQIVESKRNDLEEEGGEGEKIGPHPLKSALQIYVQGTYKEWINIAENFQIAGGEVIN